MNYYIDILNQNKELFPQRDINRLEKVFYKMDEKNTSLETLSQKEFAEIITDTYNNSILGIYAIRTANNGLKFLYKTTKTPIPDSIKNMTVNSLLEEICNLKHEWSFFKDIESVIAHVDQLGWGNFCADAKAAYVLAWHGITLQEMPDIKMSDFDFQKKTLKFKKRDVIYFSDFEIGVIKCYCDLQSFITPKKKLEVSLVRSGYLFRPCEEYTDRAKSFTKMSSIGIRTKLQKVNIGLSYRGLLPRITVKNLLPNGDFYRVYTNGLSKHMLNYNRKLQYEQYVKEFWDKKGE